MSILSKPSTSGGITPAQLDMLVSDAELDAARMSLLQSITQRIDAGVALTAAARSALVSEVSVATATLGAVPGEIRLFRSTAVPAGWTKLTGVAVPAGLFTRGRLVLAQYSTLPGNVAFHGVTAVGALWTVNSDGRLFTLIPSTGVLRAYDPGTETWTQLATAPTGGGGPGGSNFTFACAVGSKHYYFSPASGGVGSSTAYCYDAATNAWSQVASTPGSRYYARGCAVGGKVLLIGGSTAFSVSAANIVDTLALYDPAANTYTTRTMPFRAAYCRVAPVSATKVLVWPINLSVDGGATMTTNNRRCWVYDTAASTWDEVDAVPVELAANTTGTFLSHADGRVLYVPSGAPTSGARARQFIYGAAAGAQWQNFNVSTTDDGSSGTAINSSLSLADNCVLPGGLVPISANLSSGSGALFALLSTTTDANVPAADSFYAIKNA